MMHSQLKNDQVTLESLLLTQTHYENFPVASVFLPAHLRPHIALIYRFARQADDVADEGDLTVEQRSILLDGFRQELDLLRAYIKPKTPFFMSLGAMIKAEKLPYEPFYDLLDAFSQDVTKTRYQHYDDVLAYCKCSANPIGRLILHLYGKATPTNIALSDNICSALQIINFLQDIAIDFQKNDGKQRIYMCQDELAAFGITESKIKQYVSGEASIDANWQQFFLFNLHRVKAMLYAGKPLGHTLQGRIGLEMRLIIAGGEQIISKLSAVEGDVFKRRPTLKPWDWCLIFTKALFKL